MKKKIKTILFPLLLVLTAIFTTSCTQTTPYDEYDAEGYTVCIKYDANGGIFTTSVGTITDTYKLSELTSNAQGKKLLPLLSPDDERRGSGNAFTASKVGYFLAGWYTEREPITNEKGEALDINGQVASLSGNEIAYTYSGRWDFENDRMEIDPDLPHTSKEPITLYAAWIPEFKFEFYSLNTGELLDSYTFNPNFISDITLPSWNTATGKLDMERFPEVVGMTLERVYLDSAKTALVESETLKHTGTYDPSTASAENPVMKLYLEYTEGDWYRIYTAEQFVENASVSGCYEIMADLDFTEEIWKTSLIHANFRGKIIGNGHTFRNIHVEQTDTRKQNTGLFGTLTAEAHIENLTFENVTLTIGSGTLQQDAAFGLFAGTIDSGASLSSLTFKNALLQINTAANLVEGTAIGLLCGNGSIGNIAIDSIFCEAVGENPESLSITVNGNEVTVTVAP